MTTKHDEPKSKLKEYPKSSININEHRIDNKNSFKYLGTNQHAASRVLEMLNKTPKDTSQCGLQ